MFKERSKIKVAVGLSGGVDSSVSAALLKARGYNVTGVHMLCWDAKEDGCTADQDRSDAIEVASKLDIPFIGLNFVFEYKSRVIEHFYAEYKAGRTPNPDILCNKEIKFGMFLNWALENGFEAISTGHYARVENKNGTTNLLKGTDPTKDQSYFLYLLKPTQLERVIFPVGHMLKSQVRAEAQRLNLPVANKPDSVGICFIGDIDVREFLKAKFKPNPGVAVNTKGEIIGHHDGVMYYTVGQRHGFTVTKYQGIPMYVVGKNVHKNQLILGNFREVKKVSFNVENLVWVNQPPKDLKTGITVRIRHLGELYECMLSSTGTDSYSVVSTKEIFGVAPGQSAVFYSGDVVLGGGVIA